MTGMPSDTGAHRMGTHPAPLARDEVHVWIADLDARECSAQIQSDPLSFDERERAARFAREQDAARWARARALLRVLLGGYLGCDPAALGFELGEHGKPRLADERRGLRFNMSHSGTTALYAVAVGLELGVDVETLRSRRRVLSVAGRAFGAAVSERLAQLDEPEREREFLRLWTRREARGKCVGAGLGEAATVAARSCWTTNLDVEEGVAAAIAARNKPASVVCRRWS
jgi:4'-phosphopantetheinyl transferase